MKGLDGVAPDIGRATRSRSGAWEFVRDFAQTWQAAIGPADGYDEDDLLAAEQRLGVRLPSALREAYKLLGRREDLTSNSDRLLTPEGLTLDEAGEVLIFRIENQYNARWGTRLAGSTQDDPPVVFENRAGYGLGWQPWLATISLTFLEIVLSETLFGRRGEVTDNGPLEENSSALIERSYARLDFPDYPMWAKPDGPGVRWFAGPKALLREDSREWLWVLARTPEDLTAVKSALPLDWLGG